MTKKGKSSIERFDLADRVIIITGGAGLLGKKHAEAILQAGGTVVLLDIHKKGLDAAFEEFHSAQDRVLGVKCDITKRGSIQGALRQAVRRFGRVDGLVNNAANDPKVGPGARSKALMRFENLPFDMWQADLSVGLTGAFLCSQVLGQYMAEHGGGCILNIASDLALIGPDQRIYREEGLPEALQPAKPVTYSVVKSGLIGLTRYIATYWAKSGVRANALCPGGVYNGQDDVFVQRLTNLIPMGRMAELHEYQSAIVFLVSDASSYMTGSVISMDGGRTAW